MTPDTLMTEAHAPPTRPAERQGPPLKILVISPTLEPGHNIPAPIEFANALTDAGASVMFAAAIGPLRSGLSRSVGYFLIDDAEEAPVKTAHELSHLVRHHQPDVVHAHGARCAMVSALAVKASHLRCARVMTHSTPQMRRFPRWIKGPLFTHCADRYFAASDELKAELESLGVSADRIRVESAGEADVQRFARESIAVYRALLRAEDGTI